MKLVHRERAAGDRRRKLPHRSGCSLLLRFFHGVNVKLMKCGGLTPRYAAWWNTRRLGIKVMVGCMTGVVRWHFRHRPMLPLLDYGYGWSVAVEQ